MRLAARFGPVRDLHRRFFASRTEAPLQTNRAPRTRGAFVWSPSTSTASLTIDVLLRPRKAWRAIGASPCPGELFFAGVVAFAFVSFVTVSRAGSAMRRFLEDGGSDVVRAAADEALARLLHERVFGAPLVLLAGALPAALVLGITKLGARSPASARAILAIAIAGEAPILLGRLLDFEALWVDGVEMTQELLPIVRGATSLGALVALSPGNGRAAALVETASPFTIWSASLAGLAAREILGTRRRTALVAAAGTFALRLGLATLPLLEGGLG